MQQLTTLFAQATQHCEQFLQLLEQEKQALLEQDMVALEALTHAKTPLINQLQTDEHVLTRHCHDLGRSEETSLTEFISSLGEAELTAQHAVFLTTAERCQEANVQNARLIRHSQHINSTLLDLLRNQGEASQNVYDRQGNTDRGPAHRPISRA